MCIKMWKVCYSSSVKRTTSLYSFSLRQLTCTESHRRFNALPPWNELRAYSSGATASQSNKDTVTRNLFTSTSKSNFPETVVAEDWDSYPIPGTSAAAEAAGLRQGTVTEKKVWVDNDIFHSEELRAWNRGRCDTPVVPMGTLAHSRPTDAGSGISTEEISRIAEEFLGRNRFSTQHSLSHNFGQFRDIILLFLFKVSDADHPVTHLTRILEEETQEDLSKRNPYPLWRAMTLMLTAEMFGFPDQVARLPRQIHSAIRDKHDRLAKISEIVWIAHQLHRRVLDASQETTKRLKSVTVGGQVLQKVEQVQTFEETHRANKATTLVGDLLLTQKCAHLAALKSPIVTELICNSLADYCEGEFDTGILVPSHPQYFTYNGWITRCELGLGSLFGHCMYSSLLFSGFDQSTRQQAYKLGSLFGVLNQAYDDVRCLHQKNTGDNVWVDIGILPVVFQMEKDPHFLLKSHAEMHESMISTPSTISQSWEVFQFTKRQVLQALNSYEVENTVPRDILINFIHSLSPTDM